MEVLVSQSLGSLGYSELVYVGRQSLRACAQRVTLTARSLHWNRKFLRYLVSEEEVVD
jgi:hypothetical protein